MAKSNLSRTFVLEGSDETDIAGLYSLSNIEITVPVSHKFYKKYSNPSLGVTLARMGVDKDYQGQGIAKIMVVDAKDDDLVKFYQNRGLIFLQREEHTSKL